MQSKEGEIVNISMIASQFLRGRHVTRVLTISERQFIQDIQNYVACSR